MHQKLLALGIYVCAYAFLLSFSTNAYAEGSIWQKFSNQNESNTLSNSEEDLCKEHGPWLVMATSFSGPDGEREARELVKEIRDNYRLPAYYYGMTFQLGEDNPGRGIDNYGGRIRRRYQRGDHVIQHAVLVGDFPSLNDPDAQKTLKRIKHMTPQVLSQESPEATSQSHAAVRQFYNMVRSKTGKSEAKGPMGHAFLTRNPLLPKEYFVPQGIEKEVAKWNKDLEYSLMKCPGNYSVRVATFRGRSSLKGANGQKKLDKPSNALVAAAENAHFLATALREKGWEAYEFHDRQESYVTVGSFRDANVLPNGKILLKHPNAKTIIDTFGARTPNNIFNRPAQQDLQLEQQKKARFHALVEDSIGQVGQGFHPKRFVGLPFDIDPIAVRVPRESISSVYARN